MLKQLFFLFSFLITLSCFSQWNTNVALNNAIATSTNVVGRNLAKIVTDGAGGAIIVWTDNRNGNPNIYAQRINFYGNIQWTLNGIRICPNVNAQQHPDVIEDGNGGAIIVWSDTRTGTTACNIWAQRINSSGSLLWPTSGVIICQHLSNDQWPAIVSDGNGGAIVSWTDDRYHNSSEGNTDIYAQKINKYGVIQWNPAGIAICNAIRNQQFSNIVSDGAGGAIISWEDKRNQHAVYQQLDIYAQKINANGIIQWTLDGVPICVNTEDQYHSNMCTNGSGGAFIIWEDYRPGLSDIYVQGINASGVVQGTTDGVVICNSVRDQVTPEIMPDGTGGAFIVWSDFRRGGESDIYGQRVNGMLQPQWFTNGNIICTGAVGRDNPRMVSDGAGGMIVSWQDAKSAVGYDVYAQRVNLSGSAYWAANGILISSAAINQTNPFLVSDQHGGVIVSWMDNRSGSSYSEIYAQRINTNGFLCTDPVVDLGADISLCDGNAVLDAGNPGATFLWNDGTTTQTLSVATDSILSYYVTVTKPDGCYSWDAVNVVKNALFAPSGIICQGSSYTLNPTGASSYTFENGGPVVSPTVTTSYTITGTSAQGCTDTTICWVGVSDLPVVSVSDGTICVDNTFTMQPTGASDYFYTSTNSIVTPTATTSYSITGVNNYGCASTNTAVCTVIVNPKPIITVANGTICSGESFTISPTGAATYTYSSGTAVISPTISNTYFITGTSTEGCNSAYSAFCTITVRPRPTISVNSGTICSGKNFTINPSGASTYSFSSGTAIVSPTVTSSYSVTGTNSVGCVSAVVVNTVYVNSLPTLSVSSTSSLLCSGQSSSLTVIGASSYTWNTNETNSTISVSPTITTTYSVQGSNEYGCSSSVVITQSVSTCTGIDQVLFESAFNIYPNPNNGYFNIETNINVSMQLFDLLGNLIAQKDLNNGKNEVDVSNLAKGVYLLMINTGSANKSMRIFIN